jgi:hypothetical protein
MSKFNSTLMINGNDLEQAVAAGVIAEKQADALVAFVSRPDALRASGADEEQFRFISGFNDIFVSIGAILFLWALTYLLGGTGAGALGVAAAAWGLAEIFTRRRRQALPSIVLLIAFGFAMFFGLLAVFNSLTGNSSFTPSSSNAWVFVFSGICTVGAIALHWRRFHVPVTIAAGCAAGAVAIAGIFEAVLPNGVERYALPLIGVMGIGIFALAMYFDLSDRARTTRRTDIAFWLHLLAAPMIIHPLVNSLTSVSAMTPRDAGIIFAIFVAISFIALVVDRRALLVSSLSYLGFAVGSLLVGSHFGSETFAIAILAVGAIVLILSVAWQPLRKMILNILPASISQRVPIAA